MHDRVAALAARDRPDDPPKGFEPIVPRDGFDLMAGQIWGRLDGGDLIIGFRCQPRHVNNHGTCHGGMIAYFADMAAYAVRYEAGLVQTSVPTVSLSVDYLRPVHLGNWVEARTVLTKQGRNLLFATITGTVGGRAVFSAHGIFTPGPDDPDGSRSLGGVIGAG
jgi:uncharacterized protein (TIGR00369 family)